MRVLAIHEDSNANLALVNEHGVEFAVAEERLARTRFQGGFPERSLAALTHHTGVRVEDVDAVVVANRYHAYARLPGVKLPTYEHPFLGLSQKAMLVFQDQLFRGGAMARATERLARGLAHHRMRRRDVPLVDHHTAHAWSAYVPSGFAEATAVTVDNFGDGYSASVFACRGGTVERLYGSSALHSPGQFYGEVAQVLGFHPLLAGKVTALAAFGDASKAYGVVEPLLALAADEKDFVLPPLAEKRRSGRLYRALESHRREDVAAAAQRRLEDVLVPYVLRAVRETGLDRVVLAGGVFGNVAVNRRIVEEASVRELYVQPAMTDQGIALGAALAILSGNGRLAGFRMDHVFVGPGYSEREIEDALRGAGASYRRMDDPADEIAELLARGAVVARFEGRLELGPRALGNRSILVGATDPGLPERLNAALHRASFMPFAPATLADEAEALYAGLAKARGTARFMTVAFSCADRLRQSCPAVVHRDGTARPQVVSERDNPGFHAILAAYRARTGIGTVLNTSFNLHEEPIVCSPGDALRAFATSGIDHLALGPFRVDRVA